MNKELAQFVVLLASMGNVLASDGASIEGILMQADFVPHVPTLSSVKARLGTGTLINESGESFYSFRIADRRWISVKFDNEVLENHAAVHEVIYGSFPPDASSPGHRITGVDPPEHLFGIALGDPLEKLESSNVNYRQVNRVVFGRSMAIYECTPKYGEDDLFVRYFVMDGKVVAVSVGVTE